MGIETTAVRATCDLCKKSTIYDNESEIWTSYQWLSVRNDENIICMSCVAIIKTADQYDFESRENMK